VGDLRRRAAQCAGRGAQPQQPDRGAIRSPVPPGPGPGAQQPRSLFPSLDLTVGKNRSAQGTGSSSSSLSNNSSGIRDTYNAQLGVSWEIDLWGKLRETLNANEASAEASLADLAAIRLSQQSELVQNYLQLRVIDEQKRLLEATVAAYERSLKMNENQYRAGVAGPDAVAQARTQLKSTQADLIDLIWQRRSSRTPSPC
jgi:outer membrane protein TolC